MVDCYPGETAVDLVSLKILLLCVLIFVPLERVLALRPTQKVFRKGIVNDAIYAISNGPLVNLVGGVLFVPAISAAMLLVPASVAQAVSGQVTWLQVIEIIVLTDLGVYAAHRAFHAVPALWRFHSIHHGVEEMDWLAAFHSHPVDQIITKTVSLLPVFLLGFSTEAFAIYSIIYLGHGLLIHANIKMSFGPLKYVIASPQFHHWHHANERIAYDKNFAGQLAIIDAIFGTFQVPPGAETPVKYGVDDPIPANYFGQIGYPFLPRKAEIETDQPHALKPDGGV
ncbi:sterol desaturase/sphingolipid hydroxylase (fatty acid hydroxylase superfamily) [Mesorhizobium loti]|uniref:Sterol desaturase/sphingolipid hydroxylase (Fatty acid hydroxylase superfamily) n=1 Tax=Rhizobium loti TaxID=381 RepID=A0A8E2WFK2_RHILI|nr:sterol desaturase/sphingolipid hydroxylase (fatty acid hydroxylase superfamily) [Mesorhizobium loti]